MEQQLDLYREVIFWGTDWQEYEMDPGSLEKIRLANFDMTEQDCDGCEFRMAYSVYPLVYRGKGVYDLLCQKDIVLGNCKLKPRNRNL